ncbi:MAG TPA: MBL fold metallo-hydrolase [Thermomicrobiales bacterium]|jgi:L-ascorbate metabolism protein UlaG (beta-lactamase superfamily)|nr:MBL fold metallo-hydrolase [Thermomicrobiales bacterium]
MAEIRWYGHNCFRIRAREATIVTDPVGRNTGYTMPKVTADLVSISHHHPGHKNLAAIRPDPPFRVIDGPGEYEIHDVLTTGVRTYHDTSKGADRGYNTIFLFTVEGITFCHLGDLGHPLSQAQAESLSGSDVVFVPAGGDNTSIIDPTRAAEIIGQLEPKLVIPMQYAAGSGDSGLGDLTAFCKALGVETPEPEDKLTIRQSDLAESMRVVALTPES